MAVDSIINRLEAEFDNSPEHLTAIVEFLQAGASPTFIARYRRDETGDPGEDRIEAIGERLAFLDEVERRKAGLLESLQGDEHQSLRESIEKTVDQDFLDDVDHMLRPNEHKAAGQISILGLDPLVEKIHKHELGEQTPQQAAEEFIDAEAGMPDAETVLANVVLVLAERYGEDAMFRARVRNELSRGLLKATANAPSDAGRKRDTGPTTGSAPATSGDASEAEAPSAPTEDAPASEAPASQATEAAADGTTEAAGEAPAEGAAETPEAAADSTAADSTAAEAAAPEAAAPESSETEAPSTDASTDQASETEAAADTSEASADAEAPTAEGETTKSAGKKARGKNRRGGNKKAQRYEEFFDFEEPVRRIPAQRMLALRRAEREGLIQARLVLEAGKEHELFRDAFSKDVAADSPLGQFLDVVYGHAYEQLVHRPCEQIVRQRIKEKADRETVRHLARSLRSQLMAPGLPDQKVAALRASGKSVWLVCLNPDGGIAHKATLPVPGGKDLDPLIDAIVDALKEHQPVALAIPHGRREEAARKLAHAARQKIEENQPNVIPVDETASVVWATSANAKRRHSNSDTGLRATLSLARRLRDPLQELLRVEARGLGLGPALNEVHQGLLNRQLDIVMSSSLARVGVDLNRADQHLLARLPGVSKDLAKAIVTHRSQGEPFKKVEDLKTVENVGDAEFANAAGFLRISGGEQPLDATPIHPEDYAFVESLAAEANKPVPEFLGGRLPRRPNELVSDERGPKRIRDIADWVQAGNTDVRGLVEPFTNEGLKTFDDLKLDSELKGRVTNLTDFGAFVDLGLQQDGLIHITQIPSFRLRDPERVLRVGEVLTVYVVHVDPKTKRISLTLNKPRHVLEGRAPTIGERLAATGQRGRGAGGRGAGGRGRGRGQGPREDPKVRAAQSRSGERRSQPGQRRGGKPGERRGGDDRGGFGGGGGGFDRGGKRGGGRGGRGPSKPRVITVESELPQEESRGHKGELRSLSSLKNLLGGGEAKPDSES